MLLHVPMIIILKKDDHVNNNYNNWITKCNKIYYKVGQVLQSTKILFQSTTGFTNTADYKKNATEHGT